MTRQALRAPGGVGDTLQDLDPGETIRVEPTLPHRCARAAGGTACVVRVFHDGPNF